MEAFVGVVGWVVWVGGEEEGVVFLDVLWFCHVPP